jgi:hypothetical protein
MIVSEVQKQSVQNWLPNDKGAGNFQATSNTQKHTLQHRSLKESTKINFGTSWTFRKCSPV